MTDEDGNVIFENCNFSKLPFFELHKVNLMELLDGKKLLITNPLKNYFIQLHNYDDTTPRSLEDILEFYKTNLSKDIEVQESNIYNTIKIHHEADEFHDLPHNYLIIKFDNDQKIISVSYDQYLSVNYLKPLAYLDADYFIKCSQLCY